MDIIDSSAAMQNSTNIFTATQTVQGPLIMQGPMRFYDNSTHYIEFQAPSTVSTTHFNWPISDGIPGQSMTTDGFGHLFFANGAGGNGTIIPSPQFQIPFYSVSGSTNILVGNPNVTMSNGGNVVAPSITVSTITATSANFIGGSAVITQGSASTTTAAASLIFYNPPTNQITSLTQQYYITTCADGVTTCYFYPFELGETPVGPVSDSRFTFNSNGDFFAPGYAVYHVPGSLFRANAFSSVFNGSLIVGRSANQRYTDTQVIGDGNLWIDNGINVSTITVSTVTVTGQICYGNGSCQSVAGGGGGASVYPATATASFPFGASFSTITLTGTSGNAQFSNDGTNNYQIVGSSQAVTVGHIPIFSSSWSIVDGGPLGTGGVTSLSLAIGSTYTITGATLINPVGSIVGSQSGNIISLVLVPTASADDVLVSTNGTIGGGYDNLKNNGSTVTVSNVATMTETNVSSQVATGVYFDYSASTMSSPSLLGRTNGAGPSAGMIGQYISSSTVGAVAFPTTTNYGDLVAIVLTAGDWDISAVLGSQANGGTVTTMSVGISSTTGNSSAGLVEGDSFVNALGPTAATDTFASIPNFRASITTTKTYYLKFQSAFSIATPKAVGRISARRIS